MYAYATRLEGGGNVSEGSAGSRERVGHLRDQLREILDSARSLTSPSEADTEYVVIGPVLDALGWRKGTRCRFGYTTQRGERADIALVGRGSSPIAFVESKAFGTRLSDKHAGQVLGYSHAEGLRWAILTNGRQWRVYDSQRQVQDAEKLVLAVDLDRLDANGEATCNALLLLSPGAVEGDALGRFADASEAYSALLAFLDDPKAARRVLRGRAGGSSRGLATALAAARRCLPETLPPDGAVGAKSAPQQRRPRRRPLGGAGGTRARSRAPSHITLDGCRYEIAHAKEITPIVAEHLIGLDKLSRADCPLAVTRPKDRARVRYLVNTEPVHGDGERFRAPVQLSNGLWLETHYSSANAVSYAKALLRTAGLSPDLLDAELT